MAQEAAKSQGSFGQKERRERLLLLLPKHAFKVAPAGREAGYSESYASKNLAIQIRKDSEFCRRVEVMRAENLGIQEDKAVALDNRLDNLIDFGELNNTQLLKAIELRYRRLGLLRDKDASESSEQQLELSAAAKAEVQRLAIHLMHPKTPQTG